MEIPKELQTEIWEYSRVNNITNVDDFTLKVLKQGFTAAKFGSTPMGLGGEIEVKEVEKIVEKIVEKEVIKEVEVEKIVEVVVEKEVYITDDEGLDMLNKQLADLNLQLGELKSKNTDLNINLSSRNVEIKYLKEEIEKLKVELEEEKNKPKKEEHNDIYTEGKGTFGSNISDLLWPNKKNKPQ